MNNEISVTLKPVETKKASAEIYEQIRGLIVDGTILPGQRLPSERKMMEQMQRSRATIREALRLLEREGYIRTQPGSSGAIVQKPNVDHAVQSLESMMQIQELNMDNILEFRRMTESIGARLAANRRTEKDLENMKRILLQTREAFGNKARFSELDLAFHTAVAEATQNVMYVVMLQVCRSIIGESLQNVLEQGSNMEKQVRYQRIWEAHDRIYRAILHRQQEDAESEMKKHLMFAELDMKREAPGL